MGNFYPSTERTVQQSVSVGYSNKVTLPEYLIGEYGNFKFVTELSTSLADLGLRLNPKSKKFKTMFNIVKYGVPATVHISDFIRRMKKYRKIKKGEYDTHSEKEENIKKIAGWEKKDVGDSYIEYNHMSLGEEVTSWLFNCPKTSSFKIKGFYDYENLGAIADIWKLQRGNIYSLIEYKDKKYVWYAVFSIFEDRLHINTSEIHYIFKDKLEMIDLCRLIYKEFMGSFNIKENVIYMDRSLVSRKRKNFEEDIDQFDVYKFSKEIIKVLKRGRKRGYAFVGIPGTGKSTILRKLESILLDYPILYLNEHNFTNYQYTDETFDMIRNIQPCIAIMEDFDSYGFKDKSKNLGAFLNNIDDVNRDLNCVFIATVNDTDLVHYSLINRPGRFDQVIMIRPPSTIEGAYDVMRIKVHRLCNEEPELGIVLPGMQEINHGVMQDIVKNRFTQADICEIIEKCLYLGESVTPGLIEESVMELKKSKEAIKECNFNDKDPFEVEGQIDGPCDESTSPAAVTSWVNR